MAQAHKVIKVTAKQLQTIISEEASRYKRILELKRKKESVMSQLNEMYEAQEIDEIWGLEKTKLGQAVGMKTTEQKNQEALNGIMAHPAKKAVYLQAKQESPEKAQKYIEFFVNNPGVMYAQWNSATNQWVSTGKFSVASGEGTSGK